MTAKSLFDSIPFRNGIQLLKQNKKLMIVICILQALGFPILAIIGGCELLDEAMYDAGRDFFFSDYEAYAVISCICIAVATMLGVASAVNSFHELWNRSRVDMICSLPMSAKQRFFSHYLSGTVMYIVPYLASLAIGWIIFLSLEGAAVSVSSTVMESIAEINPMIFMGSTGLLFLMLMYYTLTVLTTSCCGTMFESLYTTILFNGLIPGTLAVLIGVICANSSCMYFSNSWYSIGWSSPIGGLIYLVYMLADGVSYYNGYSISGAETVETSLWPMFLFWLLKIIIVTVLMFVAAWQLYIRRRAEQVGKPFVFQAIYFVMLTLLTFLILCLFSIDSDFDLIGPGLMFSAIVYLIMEVVRKRGFRRFWKSLLAYVGTAGAVLVFIIVMYQTHCFNWDYAMPALSTVSSVEVNLLGYENEPAIDLRFNDRKVISDVYAVQKEIIQDYKKYGNTIQEIGERIYDTEYVTLDYSSYDHYYDFNDPFAQELDGYSNEVRKDKMATSFHVIPSSSVTITYRTPLGGIFSRRYEVNIDQYEKLKQIIQPTELYAERSAEWLMNSITAHKYDNSKDEYSVSCQISLRINNNSVRENQEIPGGEYAVKQFADAYKADLLAMTAEDFETSGIYCTIDYEIPVWNSCKETIRLLNEYFPAITLTERYGIIDGGMYAYDQYGYEYYNSYDYDSDSSDGWNSFNNYGDEEYYGDEQVIEPEYYYDKYQNANNLYNNILVYCPGDYAVASNDYTMISSQLRTYSSFIYVDQTKGYPFDFFTGTDTLQKACPELYEVLKVAKGPGCLTKKEGCYLIAVNDIWYFVEPENASVVEALLRCGSPAANRRQ